MSHCEICCNGCPDGVTAGDCARSPVTYCGTCEIHLCASCAATPEHHELHERSGGEFCPDHGPSMVFFGCHGMVCGPCLAAEEARVAAGEVL